MFKWQNHWVNCLFAVNVWFYFFYFMCDFNLGLGFWYLVSTHCCGLIRPNSAGKDQLMAVKCCRCVLQTSLIPYLTWLDTSQRVRYMWTDNCTTDRYKQMFLLWQDGCVCCCVVLFNVSAFRSILPLTCCRRSLVWWNLPSAREWPAETTLMFPTSLYVDKYQPWTHTAVRIRHIPFLSESECVFVRLCVCSMHATPSEKTSRPWRQWWERRLWLLTTCSTWSSWPSLRRTSSPRVHWGWYYIVIVCLHSAELPHLLLSLCAQEPTRTGVCTRLWTSDGSWWGSSPKRCWSESLRAPWLSFTPERPNTEPAPAASSWTLAA